MAEIPEPRDILLVVDRSKSMWNRFYADKARIDAAKEVIKLLLNSLVEAGERARKIPRVHVYGIPSRLTKSVPSIVYDYVGSRLLSSSVQADFAYRMIDEVMASKLEKTPLFQGLRRIIEESPVSNRGRTAIVVVSDFEATEPAPAIRSELDAILRWLEERQSKMVAFIVNEKTPGFLALVGFSDRLRVEHINPGAIILRSALQERIQRVAEWILS